MKKLSTIVTAGFLALALTLLMAPSSEAAPRPASGERSAGVSIHNPDSYQHHHGGGPYGSGRRHGGHC